MSTLKSRKLVMVNIGAFLITVIINYLSAAGLINNMSQGAVSKAYPTMITPAGYAFIIWGVIYLFIFLSFLLPLVKKNENRLDQLAKISNLYVISCVINIAWTLVFSFEIIWLSAILIIALLINIIMIILKMNEEVDSKVDPFSVGFGLYAGWLSIASVVNFLAFLRSVNFKFFDAEAYVVAGVLVLFIFLAVLLAKKQENAFYLLAIIWAFIAILVKKNMFAFNDLISSIVMVEIVILLIVEFIVVKRRSALK